MLRTVRICILSTYFNCHMHILFVVLLVTLCLVEFACLSIAGSWLLLAITNITTYLIISDGSAPR